MEKLCGIVGLIGLDDHRLVERMCSSVTHRGPDSEGYYSDTGISLGVRRLSILDLVHGDQPVFNEDGSVVIVFNGEIYNFIELRHELEKRGHKFGTNGDTEVVVHGYEEWGEGVLGRLNGMFAFCLWDSRKRVAYLARDRLGEKPLFYFRTKDVLLFGSEIKSILQYDEFVRRLNRKALGDYLTLMYIPGSETFYEGISELLPGQVLKVSGPELSFSNFWVLSFSKMTEGKEGYVNLVRRLLEDSIQLRLRSDVPVGVFLSGGIDSSAIAALASAAGKKVETFTVGFQESAYSEASFAKEVARKLNASHHEQLVSPDVFKLLPKILAGFDEPFGNPTITISYLISEFARKWVKVALSGAGGDEVFGGYPRYQFLELLQYYGYIPKPARAFVSYSARGVSGRWGKSSMGAKISKFLDVAEMDHESQYRYFVSYFSDKEKDLLVRSGSNPRISTRSNFISNVFQDAPTKDFHKQMFYVEMKSFLPYNILEYTDRTSMAVSLETRVPLLDHRLVELAGSIPKGMKYSGLFSKIIFRRAVADIVPKMVIKRKKMPFSPPLGIWLKKELRELVDQYLSREAVRRRKLLDYSAVERLVIDHMNGSVNNEVRLFGLITLELWHQLYLDGFES